MRENTPFIAIPLSLLFPQQKTNPCTPHLHRRLRTSTAGLHGRRISSPPSTFQDPARDRAFVAANPSLQDPGSNLTFTLLVNGFFSKEWTFPSSLRCLTFFCFLFFFLFFLTNRENPFFQFFVVFKSWC